MSDGDSCALLTLEGGIEAEGVTDVSAVEDNTTDDRELKREDPPTEDERIAVEDPVGMESTLENNEDDGISIVDGEIDVGDTENDSVVVDTGAALENALSNVAKLEVASVDKLPLRLVAVAWKELGIRDDTSLTELNEETPDEFWKVLRKLLGTLLDKDVLLSKVAVT